MKILAIDTTGAYSSVALNDEGKFSQIINEDDFSHLQNLVPCVEKILKDNNCDPSSLDAIAVSRGPGSFTGIRIGMATAKGLAQIWNKPIVCVPTLASFAFRDYSFDADLKNAAYCPIFDAKRHQIYGGAYLKNSDKEIVPDGAYDLDDYLELLENASDKYEKIIFFGDGVKVYEEGLKDSGLDYIIAPAENSYQTAEGSLKLGIRLYEEGKASDCYTAQPEYLRAAEAERKLAEKIKADAAKFGTAK